MGNAVEQFFDKPKVLEVCLGLEILPDLGCNKVTALESILLHAPQDALPTFAGDAASDLDAMLAAQRHGGLTIGIGPDAPTQADFRLATPANFTRVLADLADAISTV